jgi:hypothetical protein
MIIDGLSWHQFSNLPHIASLPLNRQLIEYEIYNQNLIHEVMMIQQQQQLLYPNTPSAAGAGGRLVEQIVENHIEFVVDTTDYDNFQIEITTNSEITITINWGDDQIEEFTLNGNDIYYHTYSPSGTGIEYTARVEFSDPTKVIGLDFEGND